MIAWFGEQIMLREVCTGLHAILRHIFHEDRKFWLCAPDNFRMKFSQILSTSVVRRFHYICAYQTLGSSSMHNMNCIQRLNELSLIILIALEPMLFFIAFGSISCHLILGLAESLTLLTLRRGLFSTVFFAYSQWEELWFTSLTETRAVSIYLIPASGIFLPIDDYTKTIKVAHDIYRFQI